MPRVTLTVVVQWHSNNSCIAPAKNDKAFLTISIRQQDNKKNP